MASFNTLNEIVSYTGEDIKDVARPVVDVQQTELFKFMNGSQFNGQGTETRATAQSIADPATASGAFDMLRKELQAEKNFILSRDNHIEYTKNSWLKKANILHRAQEDYKTSKESYLRSGLGIAEATALASQKAMAMLQADRAAKSISHPDAVIAGNLYAAQAEGINAQSRFRLGF